MKEVLENYEQNVREMLWKHRWVGLFYNWVIAGLVVALFVSFIIWGLDIRTERRAEDMTATAIASWQAEQEAAETAKAEELARVQASQEFVIQQEATAVAKALYGIRNFVEKYGYSEADLATYVRCMTNRADATGQSIVDVVSQKDQFLGYSDSNPVLTDDFNLAVQLIEEWHNEKTKPVDSSYQFAELTPNGIWLRADYKADGYTRRWRE